MKNAFLQAIKQGYKPLKSISFNGFDFYIKKLTVAETLKINTFDENQRAVKELAIFLCDENGINIFNCEDKSDLENLSLLPFEIVQKLQADFISYNFKTENKDENEKK